MRGIRWLPIAWVVALLIFAGCKGEDGSPGAAGTQGPPGPPGTATSTTQDSLNVTVTGVSISSPPVVTFAVTDQSSLSVANLSTSTVRFTIAKLVPAASGDASYWQSYINRKETYTFGVTPGSFGSDNATTQATTDSGGTLVYKGSGSYTYTFGTDIKTAVDPVTSSPIAYDGSLRHRLGMQISGQGFPATNAAYDFVPNGGGLPTGRDIVQVSSCNECHNKLALHGGGRVDTKFCVTCHNPGTTDANSDRTVDFKVMVHKIHSGKDLPSVANVGAPAPAEYAIWGYQNSKVDFSALGFPNDVRRCTKCHDEADTATPQAANWHDRPTLQACGSCHDDVVFDGSTPAAWQRAHAGGTQLNNSACTLCHSETGSAPISTAHAIPADTYGTKFKYEFVGTPTYDSVTKKVTVSFQVVDPTNSNAHYDLASSAADSSVDQDFNTASYPTGAGTAARLNLIVGWDTADYSNSGSGTGPGQPISTNVLSGTLYDGTTNIETAGHVYTVVVDLSATNATGSGVVALEGHPAGHDGTNYVASDGTAATAGNLILRVPVKSAVAYFAISDAQATPRRQVVDITAKCDNCHGTLSMHGANRTDEGQVCVICHNPFATDINRRGGVAGIDGKFEEAIDFKRLVHGLHSQGSTKRTHKLVVYGFSGANTFDTSTVEFPGRVSDCRTCHVQSTFALPLGLDVNGSTVDTGASVTDQTDDLKFSPTASVCSACHDSFTATSHMSQNGGRVQIRDDADAPNDTTFTLLADTTGTSTQLASGAGEACPLCHGPGRFVDVAVVHVVSP